MLRRLHIQNIALIKEMTVEWGAGFNVLTGETGAGKSITVESLLLILGERAGADLIRDGETRGLVEASFEISKTHASAALLKEQGIERDGDLVIRRELSSDGKSRAFVNGSQVGAAFLRSIGATLVDLHGQHEHQSLLNAAYQMNFLDVLGDALRLRDEVGSLYESWRRLGVEKSGLVERIQERERRLDYLRFQEKEISALNLQEGEERILEDEENLLVHAERIRGIAAHVDEIVSESQGSLLNLLAALSNDLSQLGRFDEAFGGEVRLADEARLRIQEIQSAVRSRFHGVEDNPERLRWVQERLFEIRRLKKKYGEGLEDVLRSVQAQIVELDGVQTRLEELNGELDDLEKAYHLKAARLTKLRRSAAGRLERDLKGPLAQLGMNHAVVDIEFEETPMGVNGKDRVVFRISTNAGVSPRALNEIVSGGELSRIMLAFKSLLAGREFIPVLIFDEIDVNLGGMTAHKVGLKLKELAGHHQILVITHLAQIASCADRHFTVEKLPSGKGVSTCVRLLDEHERSREIARMLGSDAGSPAALTHARELLKSAKA